MAKIQKHLTFFLLFLVFTTLGYCAEKQAEVLSEFDEILNEELSDTDALAKMTSVQKNQFWEEFYKKVGPKILNKKWDVEIEVADVEQVKAGLFHIHFKQLPQVDDEKSWRLVTLGVSLPINENAAAKINKGEKLKITGEPIFYPNRITSTEREELILRVDKKPYVQLTRLLGKKDCTLILLNVDYKLMQK